MTSKKIKILHLFYLVGGVGTSIELIAKNTDPNQFEHIIVNGADPAQIPLKNTDFTTYHVNLNREIRPFKDFQLAFQLIKICQKVKPDLIHAHSAKGGIIGKIAAFIVKRPCLHTPQAYSYLSAQKKPKRRLYLLIEKALKLLPHKILASSRSEAKRAINDLKYPENRVITFPNAINPIQDVKELSLKKTWPDNYICTVGRPSYQKNIELMIDVMYQLKKERPDIHLIIMGVGSYSPNTRSVEDKINKYQLQENVTMLEWTSRDDILHIISHAQLYLSTARYEGLPYAVIEALALSKALVLSDVDGNKDLIDEDKNGFLIFTDNTELFKQRILELLIYKEKRSSFEKHSYFLFNKYFNIGHTIKDLETIYKTESL